MRLLAAIGLATALSIGVSGTVGYAQGKKAAPKATAPSLPSDAPKDATGQCKDGSYTTATSRRGACSAHGGIKLFATAQCKDGTYSFAKTTHGACSAHGGVKAAM
jgi:hypothetical protein